MSPSLPQNNLYLFLASNEWELRPFPTKQNLSRKATFSFFLMDSRLELMRRLFSLYEEMSTWKQFSLRLNITSQQFYNSIRMFSSVLNEIKFHVNSTKIWKKSLQHPKDDVHYFFVFKKA